MASQRPKDEERTLGEWVSDTWGSVTLALQQAVVRNPPAPRYLRASLTITSLAVAAIISASLYYALRDILSPVFDSQSTGSSAGAAPEKGGLLTREEAGAARNVITGFLAAPTVREKLAFVRHPVRVEEKMGEFYRTPQGSPLLAPQTPGPTLRVTKTLFGASETIVIAMNVPADGTPVIFLVEKVNDLTYRIDWESSSGYQEMPLAEFKAVRPSEPVAFRVHVTRDEYYNYGFSEKTHQCYRLTYPLDQDFELFGFVRRGTEAADDLALAFPEIAPDGQPAGAILNLAYPKSAPPASGDFVNIVSMSLNHWMTP